ncbi:hypothetical protein [Mesorhizobium sp. M0152]|uniref:hypothetical protein n=1 Tax=Mesorhizobium sp. M0152 TaxID=2956898 RepID=UPI00333A9BCC
MAGQTPHELKDIGHPGVPIPKRKNRNTVPILLLTARDTSLQNVEGLDKPTDYLVKPFDLDELLARLRALKRRREGRTEIILKSGAIEMDPAAMVGAAPRARSR